MICAGHSLFRELEIMDVSKRHVEIKRKVCEQTGGATTFPLSAGLARTNLVIITKRQNLSRTLVLGPKLVVLAAYCFADGKYYERSD